MKITASARDHHFIRSYAPEEIRIGEQTLRNSCLITREQIVPHWPVATIAAMTLQHMEPIFALMPEVVVFGTSLPQQFPPIAMQAALLERGIGFEVMDLGAACRTFNVLLSEDRSVLAALIMNQTA